MTGIFLSSCYDWPIIKQVAWLLGKIMNLLYVIFGNFGIYNIGLCIIVFTIIIKMVLLPMTIKQQKFSKLSSLMNPEIQAIQKKYAGKRDQQSTMKMQEELQGVYQKYGTSPTGGCMTMFIQLPILLALYGVISQMPQFIDDLGDKYEEAGKIISETQTEMENINKLDKLVLGTSKDKSNIENLVVYFEDDSDKTAANIKTRFATIAAVPSSIWSDIFSAYKDTNSVIDKLKEYSEDDWTKAIEAIETNEDLSEKVIKKNVDLVTEYMQYSDAEWKELKENFNTKKAELKNIKKKADSSYSFFGADLSTSPGRMDSSNVWKWAIPILAALTQLLSVKVSNKINNTSQQLADNPMASSMNTMMYIMPIMSAVFCFTLPAGLGFYWIVNAVMTTIQTIFIGMYFKKTDLDTIIKKNIEKQNKKREKRGLPPQKITSAATANVKNIKTQDYREVNTEKPVVNNTAKKGSIASKASLVDKYNKK